MTLGEAVKSVLGWGLLWWEAGENTGGEGGHITGDRALPWELHRVSFLVVPGLRTGGIWENLGVWGRLVFGSLG